MHIRMMTYLKKWGVMMKQDKLYFILTLCAGLLSGCSENGFWFRSGSDYEDIPEQGVYYVGQPYQIKGVLYTPAEDWAYSEKGVASWYSRDSQYRLTTNGEVFDDEKMTAAHKTLPLPSLVRITNLENGNTAIVRVNDRGPAVNNRLIDVSRKTAEALEMSETGTTLVQVDILPDESRRLKDELEEYLDPNEVRPREERFANGVPVPVYQPKDGSGEVIYNGQDKELAQEWLAETPTVSVEQLPPTKPVKKAVKAEPKKSARPQQKTVVAPAGKYRIQAGVFGQSANADKAVRTLEKVAPVSTETKGNLTIVYVGPFHDKAAAQTAVKKVHSLGYTDAWVKAVK